MCLFAEHLIVHPNMVHATELIRNPAGRRVLLSNLVTQIRVIKQWHLYVLKGIILESVFENN